MSRTDVTTAYDARAAEYIDLLGSAEQMAEADRSTILAWRDGVEGRILDAGCGPGHWSDLLRDGGRRDVVAVDGSWGFVSAARRRFPLPGLLLGDLSALPLRTGTVGGILAWFSIIHTPPVDVKIQVRELARVLRPGGSLLLGFFDGPAQAAFDHAVTTAYYWSADALSELLLPQGLIVERSDSRQDPGVRRYGSLLATRASRS